jgi:hypothetical protein
VALQIRLRSDWIKAIFANAHRGGRKIDVSSYPYVTSGSQEKSCVSGKTWSASYGTLVPSLTR